MVQHMSTIDAFAMGEANSNVENMRVFDWERCAKFIKENKEHISSIAAGLTEDWGYTGGLIYNNEDIVSEENTYVWLSSTWATPTMVIQYKNGTEDEMSCYIMENEISYDVKAYWPEVALTILKEDN